MLLMIFEVKSTNSNDFTNNYMSLFRHKLKTKFYEH